MRDGELPKAEGRKEDGRRKRWRERGKEERNGKREIKRRPKVGRREERERLMYSPHQHRVSYTLQVTGALSSPGI